MSLFPISINVANHIEKLQWYFFWSGLGDESKFHLIHWSVVYTPLSGGGLRVGNLRKFNQALRHEGYIINAQFGESWGDGVRMRFLILSEWVTYQKSLGVFPQTWTTSSKWRVLCQILVQQMDWKMPTSHSLDCLEIAHVKDGTVANLLAISNGSSHWNVDFIRPSPRLRVAFYHGVLWDTLFIYIPVTRWYGVPPR